VQRILNYHASNNTNSNLGITDLFELSPLQGSITDRIMLIYKVTYPHLVNAEYMGVGFTNSVDACKRISALASCRESWAMYKATETEDYAKQQDGGWQIMGPESEDSDSDSDESDSRESSSKDSDTDAYSEWITHGCKSLRYSSNIP
jgi:hypothetical protein